LKFIKNVYDIDIINLTVAKRGFYGETWRLDVKGGSFFLKVVYPAVHKPVYKRSFQIIRHLCDHGIDFISRIKKTKDGRLFAQFDGAVLGIFDWIDGENIQNKKTKIEEYKMLAKVYTVLPGEISIPCEDFSVYNADRFFKQWNALKDEPLKSLFEKNRMKIEQRAERLHRFSKLCSGDIADFYITHGDAGGNFIENGDRYYIVDWDNPIYAPVERDAWFCMSWDWAMNAFHNSLRENGINYTLRPERLAYYCYEYFFFYLNAYLDANTQADTVEEYIDGWIEESFDYADMIPCSPTGRSCPFFIEPSSYP
jgi:Ser/Thr protein kinase RdoA (MazF antagonist)